MSNICTLVFNLFINLLLETVAGLKIVAPISTFFLDSCVVKVAMSRKNGMDFQHVISSVSMQTVMMSDSSLRFLGEKEAIS